MEICCCVVHTKLHHRSEEILNSAAAVLAVSLCWSWSENLKPSTANRRR